MFLHFQSLLYSASVSLYGLSSSHIPEKICRMPAVEGYSSHRSRFLISNCLQALLLQRFIFFLASLHFYTTDILCALVDKDECLPQEAASSSPSTACTALLSSHSVLLFVHAVHSMYTGGQGWVLLPKKPPLHPEVLFLLSKISTQSDKTSRNRPQSSQDSYSLLRERIWISSLLFISPV